MRSPNEERIFKGYGRRRISWCNGDINRRHCSFFTISDKKKERKERKSLVHYRIW
jgi:hypothetical protein